MDEGRTNTGGAANLNEGTKLSKRKRKTKAGGWGGWFFFFQWTKELVHIFES